MRNRILGPIIALAAVVAALSLVPAPALTQAASAAAKTLDLPRTPDGRPDLQGLWAPGAAGHSLEEGPDLVNAVIQGQQVAQAERPRVIVDPTPDGKIPYQPWAAEKRNENP